MTTVLSIKPSGSVSQVQLDDGTSFDCTREFARRSHLKRGQEIDAVLIERLRETATVDLARFHAQRLNSRAKYSRQEIAQRLQQLSIPISVANLALDQLAEDGALDERAVALDAAKRGLDQALRREEAMSWRRYHELLARRLAMRGFDPATSQAALRQAWLERDQPTLAQDR